MKSSLSAAALDQLFLQARTFSHWQNAEVPDALLRQLFELTIQAPTSMNSLPARFVFVKSAEAKEQLKPALAAGNIDKTMSAPVTVIVGSDHAFYEHLPRFFPQADARGRFADNPALAESTAFRNASLQGAYLIIAARALGLDAGPMSGFDADKVNETFFKGTAIKANFLINLGYGDESRLHPRNPRPGFEEFGRIL